MSVERGTRDGVEGRTTAGPVRPGALTALLADLARAPAGAGWDVPPLPGEAIGRFEIVREIGRGGFGVVYEARDAELGRSVALKTLRLVADAVTAAQSVAEAEAAARLAHPNIVHLYDVGRCERGAFLIMELLRGRQLTEWVGQPIPVRDVVRVAVEIARGLAHAHANGVVHRDLKPGNVLVCDDGQVKVLDFGLAHVFGREAVEGGTPAYMSPEQAAGAIGDERSDLYSLGVILDDLLATGGRGRARGALAKLIARLRARAPSDRPASADDVLEELVSLQRSLEPKRLLWATAAVAAIAIVAAIGLAVRARPLPAGRLLVAMADTVNATGDRDLDAVGDLLRAGLGQSKRVSIMARSRLVNSLRERGREVPATIDEPTLREVARDTGAQLLVVPAVHQVSAGGYRISVRAIDAARREPAFAVGETAASKETLGEALDRVVTSMRAALREEARDRPASPVRVAELASSHPEALRFYAEGKRLDSLARFKEAREAFEKSIEADPEFPLPRVALLDYAAFGLADAKYMDDRDREAHRAALQRNLHRLPPNDRAFAELQFLEAPTAGELIFHVNRAIEAWPEDPRGYTLAGYLLLHQRGELEPSRPYLEKAVLLAPLQDDKALDFLIALDRLDDALVRARRWTEAAPNAVSFANLAEVHRIRGELAESMDVARRGFEFPGTFSFSGFVEADALEEAEALIAAKRGGSASWLAMRGRAREALAMYDRKKKPPPEAPLLLRLDYLFFRHHFTLAANDLHGMWRELEAAFRLGAGPDPCEAWALALLGDVERAFGFSRVGGDDRLACQRVVAALHAWKGGHREEALRRLDGVHVEVRHLYRAEILLELNRPREAYDEVRRYRRRHGATQWDFFVEPVSYPRSVYVEALALERLGEREEARRTLGRLLHLWERADPELPLLGEARVLDRRLAAGPG